MEGPGADSEEKHEPASDIDTVVVDSLKALDPKRPIREATNHYFARNYAGPLTDSCIAALNVSIRSRYQRSQLVPHGLAVDDPFSRSAHEHADAPHSLSLLRAHRQRPSNRQRRCASESSDELTP